MTLDWLTTKQRSLLDECHPHLKSRVEFLLEEMGGRVVPLCAFRDPRQQLERYRFGRIVNLAADGVTVISATRISGRPVYTNAKPMESPHNWKLSLAMDVVLNPAKVAVGPHPQDKSKPNLWEMRWQEYPEAKAAWLDLGRTACNVGLDWGGSFQTLKDYPHLQLQRWQAYRGPMGTSLAEPLPPPPRASDPSRK